jgi:hypothetical protein
MQKCPNFPQENREIRVGKWRKKRVKLEGRNRNDDLYVLRLQDLRNIDK